MEWAERWRRDLHERWHYQRPTVVNDLVVTPERRSHLVGLDLATGELRWDVAHVGSRALALTAEHCVVLDGRLVDIDPATGTVRWSVELPRYTDHLAVAGDVVLAGGWRAGGPLTAYGATDGRRLWAAPESVRTVPPTVWAGGLLLGHGSDIWLVDPHSGAETCRWRLPDALSPTDIQSVFTPVDEHRCVVRCRPFSLVQLDRRSAGVRLLARHDRPLLSVETDLADGLAWIREVGGAYLGFDLESGDVARRIDVGAPLAVGVVATGSAVTVATIDGQLVNQYEDGTMQKSPVLSRRISSVEGTATELILLRTKGGLLGLEPADPPTRC